jgi:hypothetical protein
VNVAQFQRVARLATIASQVVSDRGVDVLNLLLEHAGLNGNVKSIREARIRTNDSRGHLVEGLVFLRVEVIAKAGHNYTLWLEVNSHDKVVFDVS